jgi:hypothetical protein
LPQLQASDLETALEKYIKRVRRQGKIAAEIAGNGQHADLYKLCVNR